MKKKVLYISNIEVPYRTLFFNELAKHCDLTVLYERRKSSNRNSQWTSSQKSKYRIEYLDGINIKNEYSFSFKINRYINSDFDVIIFGCYNSPAQMYAKTLMQLKKRKFYINMDGEYFLEGSSIKCKIKRFFIQGAEGYLIAGEQCGNKLKNILNNENVYPYYFSSLTNKEIELNSRNYQQNNQGDYILVIGQYFDYKGLDIALDVAEKLPEMKFKFIGMSKRADKFKELVKLKKLTNVEVIPFLTKESLNEEYKNCKLLLLTSRRECWGLVINEAASFGCPIIASKYAGAAIEFISEKYKNYLIDPYNIEEIVKKIKKFDKNDTTNYKKHLINTSKLYSIENNVLKYLDVIEKESDSVGKENC